MLCTVQCRPASACARKSPPRGCTLKIQDKTRQVHHLDQTEIKLAATEIKSIEDKAATEIKLAKADVARVEGERRLSEERLRAEVERYKYDLRLTQTQDFKPYHFGEQNKEGRSRRTAGLAFGTMRAIYKKDTCKDFVQWSGLSRRGGHEWNRTHTRQMRAPPKTLNQRVLPFSTFF